jgi:glycosyltransferase involved in cell wall biosynthesis
MRQRASRGTADVFYFRYPPSRYMADRLPALQPVKALEINGKEILGSPDVGAFAAAMDLVLVASPQMRSMFAHATGFPESKIGVHINTAADTGLFRPLDRAACRREVNWPDDRQIVLFVTAYQAHHDFRTVFEAVKLLAVENSGVLLVLVGDGPRRREVQGLFTELVKDGKAVFVDAVSRERLPLMVGAADACLNIVVREKLVEGNSNTQKLIEYLACARPVVETVDRSLPIQPWAEECMYFAEAGSPASLCEAIQAVLDDPARARARAKAGREYVEGNRTWLIAAQRTIEKLSEAAAQKAATSKAGDG